MIHPLADVKSKNIGEGTNIWQFSVILDGATIGSNCNINCHTFVEGDVTIGNNVTVKSGVYLWNGITVEDDVFIGPNATFTNDKYPRSKRYPQEFQRTLIGKGASIGAGAIILGGVTIGAYSIIAAGALVTKSIPSHCLVVGSPARIVAHVDEYGNKLVMKDGYYVSYDGKKFTFPKLN